MLSSALDGQFVRLRFSAQADALAGLSQFPVENRSILTLMASLPQRRHARAML